MTIYQELVNAGLPVIVAEENGNIIMGAMTPEQDAQFNDITLQYFQVSEYNKELERRTFYQQVKTEYQNMITRLEQIQNAGAIPFTQAGFNQVVQAVKDEALYIERIMKVLNRLI